MRGWIMAALLSTALATEAPAESAPYRGYEIPSYTVEASAGPIELRSYGSHTVAEVYVRGNRRQGASAGFRALANYIFGGNAGSQKIAMTAPVTQVDRRQAAPEQADWAVRFMMPSQYSIETLPKPKNAAVTLRDVEPGRRLVIRFSGRAMTGSLDTYVAQLRAFATQNGLTLTGPMEVAYYDDPFTLPWRRRNEVSFTVE